VAAFFALLGVFHPVSSIDDAPFNIKNSIKSDTYIFRFHPARFGMVFAYFPSIAVLIETGSKRA
jgi:hypothetical protein